MLDSRWGRGPELDVKKLIWFGGHGLVAGVFAWPTLELGAVLVCAVLAVLTGCLGHSVGVHRLMIHRAFITPRAVERGLVYLGALMGMAGPLELVHAHHVRDTLQHQRWCPDFFCHRSGLLRDLLYNFFCRYDLPKGVIPTVSNPAFADPLIRWLDRTWRWQQLPLAVTLYAAGGWSWVVWGVCVRVVGSAFVHWYVGYRCHNDGERRHPQPGGGVEGTNHFWLGILSFGEGFHNNHHAFPRSARMGHGPWELDLGYGCVRALEWLGLASEVQTVSTATRVGSPGAPVKTRAMTKKS